MVLQVIHKLLDYNFILFGLFVLTFSFLLRSRRILYLKNTYGKEIGKLDQESKRNLKGEKCRDDFPNALVCYNIFTFEKWKLWKIKVVYQVFF